LSLFLLDALETERASSSLPLTGALPNMSIIPLAIFFRNFSKINDEEKF
jgi:hypothetical protein